MKTISITTEFIKLQDLLKFASIVSTGGEAKLRILDGEVSVNGEAASCHAVVSRSLSVRLVDFLSRPQSTLSRASSKILGPADLENAPMFGIFAEK